MSMTATKKKRGARIKAFQVAWAAFDAADAALQVAGMAERNIRVHQVVEVLLAHANPLALLALEADLRELIQPTREKKGKGA
jgi:uncharacterized protein with PhoU and TrkA domain